MYIDIDLFSGGRAGSKGRAGTESQEFLLDRSSMALTESFNSTDILIDQLKINNKVGIIVLTIEDSSEHEAHVWSIKGLNKYKSEPLLSI